MKNNDYYTLKDLKTEFEVSLDYLSLLNLEKDANKSVLEKSIKNINKAVNYLTTILNNASMSFYADLKSIMTYIGFAKSHLDLIFDINDRDKTKIEKAIIHLDNVKTEIENIVCTSHKKGI